MPRAPSRGQPSGARISLHRLEPQFGRKPRRSGRDVKFQERDEALRPRRRKNEILNAGCASYPLATVLLGAGSLAVAQDMPVTVCQALNSVQDHKDVTVTGILIGESHHGFSLSGGINGDPCPGWPRRFFTAPSIVGLDFTSAHAVKLTEEQKQLNLSFLDRLWRSDHGSPVQLPVIVRGVLVKRPWSLIFRRSDGSYISTNFDPYGWLPVTIVIKSISD